MIFFRGRGYSSAVVEITVNCYGARIRTDCNDNPEVWGELLIPYDELLRLAELVRLRRQEEERDALLISRGGLAESPPPKQS